MDYFIIEMDENVTSYKFYHYILQRLHNYAVTCDSRKILLDFSNTKNISPLVIPNLLCVGYLVNENYNTTPLVFVPDNKESDGIRAYLQNIKLVSVAREYGLLEFTDTIDCGERRNIVKEGLTHAFNLPYQGEPDESVIRTEISEKFGLFFKKYFQNFRSETYNLIEEACGQIIYNSMDHGKSFAIMTAQVIEKSEKVYVSVSDCGIGLKSCINQKIKNKEEPFAGYHDSDMMADELTAIIYAIFARAEGTANKVYGLYPMVSQLLKSGGTVRIHSANTQIILTDKMLSRLEVATSNKEDIDQVRQSFLKLINTQKSDSYNVYKNMKYKGTHIEFELPYRGGCI